ncbi:hypothetical protein [Asticcacaulis solisilvae]|uniref:hypothetical protein n=1 Tax=Asticcacaulis solisilvae TaxID=1217274 RepID=UPI003FD8C129
MTFRRFLAWIVEKAVEWLGLSLLLVAAKFVLPTDPDSFRSLGAFTAGMNSQLVSSLDEAVYMARAFMGGSMGLYALKLIEAAAYLVGIQFYFWSFYLFTSIFACLTSHRGYVAKALLALVVSAVVLMVRLRELADLQSVILAGALMVGGLIVTALSALFGQWLDGRLSGKKAPAKKAPPSPRRGVRLDFSQ